MMPRVHVVELGNNRSDYKARINGEVYVTSGSFETEVSKWKKGAKMHNWTALDMFPVVASGCDYGAITYIIRIAAVKAAGEELKKYICHESEEYFAENHARRYEEAIRLSEQPWTEEGWSYGINEITEEKCQEAIDIQKERVRLLHMEEVPDVEDCIRILKEKGYKILAPEITYKEV